VGEREHKQMKSADRTEWICTSIFIGVHTLHFSQILITIPDDKQCYLHGHSRAWLSHLQTMSPTWFLVVKIGCMSHHICGRSAESTTCPRTLPQRSKPILGRFYLCNTDSLYKGPILPFDEA
jgi:hypothetical protein